MELFVVRHTSVNVPKGHCYGHSDVPLSSNFDHEAHDVLEGLLNEPFDAVISSPSARCIKLAQKFSFDVQFDDRLMEMDFGDWEGMNWNDISGPYVKSWMDNYIELPTPNGESFIDLTKRVVKFLGTLKQDPYNKVLIVSHGGPIRSIYSLLHNIPLANIFDIKVEFGSIHKFKL